MKKLNRFNKYQLIVANLLSIVITLALLLVNDLQPQANLNLLPSLVTYSSSVALVGLPVIVVLLFGVDQLSHQRLSLWYSVPFVLSWAVTLVMTTVKLDWSMPANQILAGVWLFGWISGVVQILTRQNSK